MKSDDIRKMMLNDNEEARKLMLTTHKIAIIKFLGEFGKTSPEVTKQFNKRLEASSAVLFDLCKNGYLTREDVGDPSGGTMYVYKSRF